MAFLKSTYKRRATTPVWVINAWIDSIAKIMSEFNSSINKLIKKFKEQVPGSDSTKFDIIVYWLDFNHPGHWKNRKKSSVIYQHNPDDHIIVNSIRNPFWLIVCTWNIPNCVCQIDTSNNINNHKPDTYIVEVAKWALLVFIKIEHCSICSKIGCSYWFGRRGVTRKESPYGETSDPYYQINAKNL